MGTVIINHWAVISAAIFTFLLGGLWWSPIMFEKAWKTENNFTDEFLKKGNMPKIFGLSFVFTLVMAYNLAFFIGDQKINAVVGALYGFLTGFGWVAMSVFVLGLFERKTWRYMFINGGFMIVSFTIMGLIIGTWK